MTKLPVDPSVDVMPFSSAKLLRGMLLTCFKNVEHLFTLTETNEIIGAIRNNNLDVHDLPCVVQKLDEARATGNLTVPSFRALYQFASLLKKYPRSGNDQLCKDTAYAKLLRGERDCFSVNRTIDQRISADHRLFNRTRAIIDDVLGSTVPRDFLKTDIFFGPGSTVNIDLRTFEETSTFFKISDKLVVTEAAEPYLRALMSYHPNWMAMLASHYHTQRNADETYLQYENRIFKKHLHVVDGEAPARIGFVPKNADEHRTIGIEFNGMVPLQKVVGDLIRRRLKQVGINLDSQQRNKHMARLAKSFGLATIDLANASSSISLELVRALLPPEWFAVINDFRASHGECPSLKGSEKIRYEMVSSMGNGFTFELESLIFYALAKATAQEEELEDIEIKRSISVFGDDIIIPAQITKAFYNNLALFGFTANVSKSFTEGFFYESCGADYYDGTDVRPFFLKRVVENLRDMLFLMNSIMYVSVKHKSTGLIDLYTFLFKKIPHKPYGPMHFESAVSNSYEDDMRTDDMEACLRVPLMIAQANGGVKFDVNLHAWQYKKYVRVAISHPLERNGQYAVQHARFMTFLRGQRSGKVLLRGRTRTALRVQTTSRWDGCLSARELSVATHLLSRCYTPSSN